MPRSRVLSRTGIPSNAVCAMSRRASLKSPNGLARAPRPSWLALMASLLERRSTRATSLPLAMWVLGGRCIALAGESIRPSSIGRPRQRNKSNLATANGVRPFQGRSTPRARSSGPPPCLGRQGICGTAVWCEARPPGRLRPRDSSQVDAEGALVERGRYHKLLGRR